MKWTTETPTEEGIYWLKRGDDAPTTVHLDLWFPEKGLTVSYFGRLDSCPIGDYEEDKWYGPIDPPNEDPITSELITAQMEARRLRNALREVVKGMRSRAEPVGPLSGLWDDIFEYEMLINGRGDTFFDWDGENGPMTRNCAPNTPPIEE